MQKCLQGADVKGAREFEGLRDVLRAARRDDQMGQDFSDASQAKGRLKGNNV